MVPIAVSSLFQSHVDGRLDAFAIGNTPALLAMVPEAMGYAGPTFIGKAPPKPDSTPAIQFWGNLLAAKIDQQDTQSIAGYHATAGGLIAGADAPITDYFRAGGAFGFATSQITDNVAFGNNTGLDTYEGLVYGSVARPWWYLNASFGFAYEDYTGSRRISFPGLSSVASESHSGDLYLAHIESGVPISFAGFAVVPVASFDWGHLVQNGYTETSSAGAALSVANEVNDSLRSVRPQIILAGHVGARFCGRGGRPCEMDARIR
jgi:outer membrane autotransporter protein